MTLTLTCVRISFLLGNIMSHCMPLPHFIHMTLGSHVSSWLIHLGFSYLPVFILTIFRHGRSSLIPQVSDTFSWAYHGALQWTWCYMGHTLLARAGTGITDLRNWELTQSQVSSETLANLGENLRNTSFPCLIGWPFLLSRSNWGAFSSGTDP